MINIKLFIISFLIFIFIDFLWIGLLAKSFYFDHYQPLLRLQDGQLQPILWPALMVYILFAIATLVFILPLAQANPMMGAFYGAVLGFVIYGVYDCTCYALFKDINLTVTLVDWVWGTVLCTLGGGITTWISTLISK